MALINLRGKIKANVTTAGAAIANRGGTTTVAAQSALSGGPMEAERGCTTTVEALVEVGGDLWRNRPIESLISSETFALGFLRIWGEPETRSWGGRAIVPNGSGTGGKLISVRSNDGTL